MYKIEPDTWTKYQLKSSMPKQFDDRKSLKMIDVIKKFFRNRISCKVKFNYLSEMASNIEMSFLDISNLITG